MKKILARSVLRAPLFLIIMFLVSPHLQATVYYVKPSGNDVQPGISWAFAFQTLTKALSNALPGDVINVAQGIYKPSSSGVQNASFNIPSFIAVYGGYAPTGSPTFASRNPTLYPTILSGDLNNNNTTDFNDSYHVVRFTNVATGTLLDGFSIENGNAGGPAPEDAYAGGLFNMATTGNYSNPLVRNCIFRNNAGAVANYGSAIATYADCFFADNEDGGYGAFANIAVDDSITIDHCVFSNNTSHLYNGLHGQQRASNGSLKKMTIVVRNSLFLNNNPQRFMQNRITSGVNFGDSIVLVMQQSVVVNPGFMYNECFDAAKIVKVFISNSTFYGAGIRSSAGNAASLHIKNSIMWGDIEATDLTEVSYSDTYARVFTGPGNFSADPLFLNAASPLGTDNIFGTSDDGLQLSACSPVVNAGDNSGNILPLDAAGGVRVFNSQIDMGAYELQMISQSAALAVATDQASRFVYSGTNVLLNDNSNCRLLARVTPSGTNPINGKVLAIAHIDATVQQYNGIPYVQRHIDVHAPAGQTNATGTITLYFTQAEFNAYNAARGVLPPLPAGPVHDAGKGNLKITQYQGTSSSFLPGTYTGPASFIDPDDVNIVWNVSLLRWEVTFNVTGFGGFFVHTTNTTAPLSNIYYVKPTGNDGHAGTSWGTAFQTLTKALSVVQPLDVINVAEGKYLPSSTRNVFATFTIPSTVRVYGGYPATGTPTSIDRDAAMHPTILSGDFNGNGRAVFRNLVYFNNVAHTTVLDGFILEFAAANALHSYSTPNAPLITSSPQVSNCVFRNNTGRGAAVFNEARGKPVYAYCHFFNSTGLAFVSEFDGDTVTIDHCNFENNQGHMFTSFRTPGYPGVVMVKNCFFNRDAGTYSIAQWLNHGQENLTVVLKNSVLFSLASVLNLSISSQNVVHLIISGTTVDNSSIRNVTSNGGTVDVKVNNSIIWGNLVDFDPQATLDASYSNFLFPTPGTGNLALDPQFVNPASPLGADGIFGTPDDGLRLADCSPLVNAGNNLFDTSLLDVAGQLRVFNQTIDMGAYEVQSIPQANGLSVTADRATNYVYTGSTPLLDDNSNCRLLATVSPSGVAPINGSLTAITHIDAAVQKHNGLPYVQRHIDIEPVINAANATATITIYFLQSEFDAYNVVRGSLPFLPRNPTDAAGINNLRVSQCHGTSATFVPGSYTGTITLIDPNDANIVWSASDLRWEVTFDVTGFSGFFVHTGLTALPLSLGAFSGVHTPGNNILSWSTYTEVNTAYFEIQRSVNGTQYETIGTISAAGNSAVAISYQYTDKHFSASLNYYRLKMIDLDGSFTYAPVISLRSNAAGSIYASPNPFNGVIMLQIQTNSAGSAIIRLLDINGRQVFTTNRMLQQGANTLSLAVSPGLAPGVYTLQVEERKNTKYIKVIKQ